ncbi:2-keto-4-pentenoate hydratase [Paraburkholderia sp. ZP32-5]|uniref:2-keto-4-pentenoate hydratase n=1 Tax=Paraburkholderia sp. ZP32-5 TaxID=2883245 RepID=UPI001F3BCC36|nr:fumarylacetoacetate hydrolase family protein [Paraburkholderia sp. ZP32-5]
MSEAFNPNPPARLLLATWDKQQQIDALPPEMRPADLEQGYRIQDRLIDTTDDFVSGWKLGVGSPAAMRAAGASRPLIGQLLSSRCYSAHDAVRISSAGPVTVEFEIVFVLGCDVPPDSDKPIERIVEAAHVGFEFVLSRYVDRRAVGQPSFVADNVGFEACVLGPQIAIGDIGEVAAQVVVSVDGAESARGLTGDDVSAPWLSLQYLLDHARERDITLRRGEIVFTGAAAKPVVIDHQAFRIAAAFPGGELDVHVEAGR